MSSPLTIKTMLLVCATVTRRARRGSWAYILALIAWLPPMVFGAGNMSFHVRPYQLLPLLIPVVVVLVQLAYPTLLGWVVIVIPVVFCTGVMVFFVIITAPGRVGHDLAGLAISSVVDVVYLLVCAALWFARPKLVDAVVGRPNASPAADSAGAPPASVS
jgi:hypothetical protein